MAKLSIKPLADRVVIEPAAAEQKTASGIIIPDTAKEKHQMTLKVGDTVIYGKYAGTEFHLDGKDYMIMRENDVIAII